MPIEKILEILSVLFVKMAFIWSIQILQDKMTGFLTETKLKHAILARQTRKV